LLRRSTEQTEVCSTCSSRSANNKHSGIQTKLVNSDIAPR